MKKFNWNRTIALCVLVALIAVVATSVVYSTTSTSAGKNMGWFRKGFPTFRPQFQTIASASTAANTAIYCPGIKTSDYIFMCISFDSLTTNRNVLVNLTDSCYIQANDTIGIGTATLLGADLLVGWQKANY